VKTVIIFFSGIIVSGLLLLGIVSAVPIFAQSDNLNSDNFSLVELLPDLEKIYREALITPLLEAEKKIQDEDIANFYRRLLERTELDTIDNGTE